MQIGMKRHIYTFRQHKPMEKKLKIGWFSFSCCEDSIAPTTKLYAKINGKLFYGDVEELETQITAQPSVSGSQEKYYLKPKLKLEVLSVEGSSKKEARVVWKEAKHLIKHFVRKPMFRITLRTGKTIDVTGDHSLFKRVITNRYKGNYQGEGIEKIYPCRVSDVVKGD